jgi:hypothetical protein
VRYWYVKRYRIGIFFSDQKSRGFNLHIGLSGAPLGRKCPAVIPIGRSG